MILLADSEITDQTTRMCRLILAFPVRNMLEDTFLHSATHLIGIIHLPFTQTVTVLNIKKLYFYVKYLA